MINAPLDEYLTICISFLNEIGIKTKFEKPDEPCFLPGLSIRNGTIIIDREALIYPGDILHEAGHIAIVPAAERAALTASAIEKREQREAEEMMAIAWSYAACVHLGLDPYVVFHDEGYQGGGGYIADNFNNKSYFGLPMLQWKGMAVKEKNARALSTAPYPHMIKWMMD
ncbi:MAG: hypothetical protein IPL84_01860 [Chitinophagaceae bacterium]|nr:hypothetical protein [Chitinophagaceae bacterium]